VGAMLYNYNTPIYARVHSRKLGLLRWSLVALILVYILFWSMLYKGGYLKEEAPIGTVRFSVQHAGVRAGTKDTPCHDPFEPGCHLALHLPKELPYCVQNAAPRAHKKFPCRHLDATESTTVFEKSLLIATRITEYTQQRACPWGKNGGDKRCSGIWTSNAPTTFFVADVDDVNLVLDHAIDTPTLGVTAASRTSPQGSLVSTDDATCASTPGADRPWSPCKILPNTTSERSGLDVLRLSTLIRSATGIGLDTATTFASNHSLRYTGMVLVILIEYSNFVPFFGVVQNTTYNYRVSFIRGTGAKILEQEYLNSDHSRRILQKRHGVLLAVKFSGALRQFDWSVCLITLTTSLALLAVATTVVDALAMYMLKESREFDKVKYIDVKLGSEVSAGQTRKARKGEEAEDDEDAPLIRRNLSSLNA
jgi:hypothetical protein